MSLKSLLLTRVSHPSYTGGNGGWLDPAGIILDVRQPKLVSAALGRFGLVGSLLEETTMGIMDDVKGKLCSLQGSDSKGGSLLSGVMEMFSGQGSGGLQGLVNLFHQRGLGDKVSSWVSRGENQAISPEEVKQGLGNDKVRDL